MGAAIEVFDGVRAALDDLERQVDSRVDDDADRTEQARLLAIATLVAALVATLAATAAGVVLFRRWVLRPLAEIGSSARRLGHDDTVTLPHFDIVELEDVADAIRAMQWSLADARDRAVTAYEGLAQSAVLALHVRSQLSNELGELPNGWQVESMLEPATGVVAGDCYDLGLLDPHTLYVVMIDVTGHGAVPALDALKAKSQLRAALRSRLAPGAALGWLAQERQSDPEADLMTALVALIDVDTGVCEYANAGHQPMLVGLGSDLRSLRPTGPLLGAFASSWATRSVTIEPGALVIAYTDGVIDALGADRERFGEQRLMQALASIEDGPVAAVAAVRAELDRFQVGARADDQTLVILQRPAGAGTGVAGQVATMRA